MGFSLEAFKEKPWRFHQCGGWRNEGIVETASLHQAFASQGANTQGDQSRIASLENTLNQFRGKARGLKRGKPSSKGVW